VATSSQSKQLESVLGSSPVGVPPLSSPRPKVGAAPDFRIVEIDVLRGIALIGIYWINVVIFAFPHGAYSLPILIGDAKTANVTVWAFSDVFVEGTMRGLFSLLFGASTLIFLDEAKLEFRDGLRVVDRYYRRCLTLMMFGLLHAYVLLAKWDLLYAYGLLGMFLFPLRNLSARTLIVLGLLLFIISDFNTWSETQEALKGYEELRGKTSQQIAEYRDESHQGDVGEMELELVTYLSGYSDIFRAQAAAVAEQQSSSVYADHFFGIGGMMLLGMALMKLGILTGKRSIRFYTGLALAGYGLGGSLRGIETYELWLADFVSETRNPSLFMPYNIGRIAMTLGHVGLIGALMKVGWMTGAASYLSPVGRLALTNYVGQTLFSVFFFYGVGLGFFGYFERYQLIWVFLAVVVFQIIASRVWLRRFRVGPLEWLWRSMIYGSPQPLLRVSAS